MKKTRPSPSRYVNLTIKSLQSADNKVFDEMRKTTFQIKNLMKSLLCVGVKKTTRVMNTEQELYQSTTLK